MVVLRRTIGNVLRDQRRSQGRTLREVSSTARVSLGYLSEVERGQKEASSELLASICSALELPLSHVLQEVTVRVAAAEHAGAPYAAEGVVATGTPEPVGFDVEAATVADRRPDAVSVARPDDAVETVPDVVVPDLLPAEVVGAVAEALPEDLQRAFDIRRRLASVA